MPYRPKIALALIWLLALLVISASWFSGPYAVGARSQGEPVLALAPTARTSATAPSATVGPSSTVPVQLTVTPPPARPTAVTNLPIRRGDLVLVGATLIDGGGGPPLKDSVVVVRGNRIVAVGRVGQLAIPQGMATRNLRGTTLLPGLVNAHVHINTLPDHALKLWPRTGVTTIRDLAGPHKGMVQRRNSLLATKDASYPRLLVAGPFITVAGGHPIPRNGISDEVLTVQGPADARAKTNALLNDGVDLIKIVVSGRTDVKWNEISNEEIRAITEAAHARGARVTAHVDRSIALQRAIENGIDDAAHMPRDTMSDKLIAFMVARNVMLVPTIDVYESLAEERKLGDDWRRFTLPIMQDNLRRFVAAGGQLALGDDFGGNPGVAQGLPLAEIEHWRGAGLTPMQIIVAATRGSAVVSGLGNQLGLVQAGMLADLLVVGGDPLIDLRALTRVVFVVHNGAIITP